MPVVRLLLAGVKRFLLLVPAVAVVAAGCSSADGSDGGDAAVVSSPVEATAPVGSAPDETPVVDVSDGAFVDDLEVVSSGETVVESAGVTVVADVDAEGVLCVTPEDESGAVLWNAMCVPVAAVDSPIVHDASMPDSATHPVLMVAPVSVSPVSDGVVPVDVVGFDELSVFALLADEVDYASGFDVVFDDGTSVKVGR